MSLIQPNHPALQSKSRSTKTYRLLKKWNNTMRLLLTGLILALSLPAFGVTQTRTSSFSYDANTGLLIQEVIEPDNTALRLQTDYVYDSYGNKTSVTVSGVDIVTRTSTTTYDARGQFPSSSANAKGHTETRVFDPRFGTVTSLTGPNLLTTTWQYDGFGRKILETRADATSTTISYNQSDANCTGYAYSVSTVTSGAPNSGTCYDTLNREIRSYAQGFDGTIVRKDTQYDSLGRAYQVSRPYYAGGTAKWTSTTYDSLSRVYQITDPDGSHTTSDYNGLTTTLTDANNHATVRVKNSQGQLIQVTDAKAGITRYSYDPFGNLTQTVDAKNNITTLAYDIRGRKTSMIDPDMGSWSCQYNILGELTQQTDARLQDTTMTYDKLGRMLTRSEPDLSSTWAYDTAAKGIGKPASVTAGNGFSRSYAYDSLGRNSQVTSVIDTAYTASTSYDAYGRVATYTYPTGFAVKNVYNHQGYLAEVRNNATNALYWQATNKDAEGHLLNQTLGNALTTTQAYDPNTSRLQSIFTGTVQNVSYGFDSIGNLLSRSDSVQTLVEGFTYDELNRLKTYSNIGGNAQTYDYDSIGNITYKSDQGFYTYGSSRPHAVTDVPGTITTNNYTYDANGNLTSGAGRSVTWNSFNMVSQITQGANTLSFNYDSDHARIKQVGPDGTTIYLNPRMDLGGHFEKTTKTGGTIEYQHYLYAGNQAVGVYTSRSTGINDTKYFHTDHLGSIAVVTNESGAVIARYSYDPYGNRTTVAGDAHATHHGFTGHETMDEVGLVNMNGRVYDPLLARFMSADPHIQAPGNGQSFNRYSYVFNNPLSATDPSGYLRILGHEIRAFNNPTVRAVATIAVAVFAAPYAYAYAGLMTGSTIAAGAAAGATVGLAAGGTLKSTVTGGITGGITGGLDGYFGDSWSLQRVGANSFAGGINSELRGGSFTDGFKSSFGSSALTYMNYSMRQEGVAQSKLFSYVNDKGETIYPNANGSSAGFFGDGFKLAGARVTQVLNEVTGKLDFAPCESKAGGCQGAYDLTVAYSAPNLAGIAYSKGELGDILGESFAGPHDWLRNATGAYDKLTGNSAASGVMDSVMNYALIPVAAPFAAAALVTTTPFAQDVISAARRR